MIAWGQGVVSETPKVPHTILAVHSSSARLGVAITRGISILSERILPPSREHLERLAPLIREMVAVLPGQVKGIDAYAVARGPGSFSGIRVGIATVKGIALALGKPLLGISSLEILAWQGLAPGESGIAMIDARRGEFFLHALAKSQDGLTSLDEPRVVHSSRLLEYAGRFTSSLVLCKDATIPPLDVAAGHFREVAIIPAPSVCALLARKRFGEGAVDEVHTVVPLYLRRSDAEENRRERRAKTE